MVRENQNEPVWENAARDLIKALILFVLTSPEFDERRNLVTVRQLLMQGHWLVYERLKRLAGKEEPPFKLLWTEMRSSNAFDGVVSGVGVQFFEMPDKTRQSVLFFARNATNFIDSPLMRKLLVASDFNLGDIKSDPKGITIYLTLPRRHTIDHFRWLRMMINLAVSEMERIKGPPAVRTSDGKPCPTLFVLDEFAGLQRMEVVEHATAQGAGFGVKFMFVVQHFPQLKEVYKDAWETYFSSAGLKLFFHVEDGFTKEYLSRQIGDQEILTKTRSGSESQSDSTFGHTRRVPARKTWERRKQAADRGVSRIHITGSSRFSPTLDLSTGRIGPHHNQMGHRPGRCH